MSPDTIDALILMALFFSLAICTFLGMIAAYAWRIQYTVIRIRRHLEEKK